MATAVLAFAALAWRCPRAPPPRAAPARAGHLRLLSVALPDHDATTFDLALWRATEWERLNTFERMVLMRGLLDGRLSAREANHAAWRGLGYTVAEDGGLRAPDGAPCAEPPDVLQSPASLAAMARQLPREVARGGSAGDGEDEDVDDLDDEEAEERANLNTLIETLHGEEMTRVLLEERDADFLARRTLVSWLYKTQDGLALDS